jgi:arabinofuranosyltransferase
MPDTPDRRPAIAAAAIGLLSVGLALFVRQVIVSWPFTVDDAFILMRYGRNLAEHGEPTLNVGEPPVEGISSVLWMTVLAVPQWLGLDTVLFAKLGALSMMVLAFVGTGTLAARLAGQAGATGAMRLLAAASAIAVLAAMPATGVHAVSGLCTAVFTAAVVWLGAACAGHLMAPRGRSRWAIAGLALLTGLARPEGNLVAVCCIAATIALLPRDQRRPLLGSVLLGYVLPGAIWFGIRWAYYGLPLPLPIYLKMTPPGSFGVQEAGLAVTGRLWSQLAWALLLAALPGVWWWRRAAVPAVLASAALFAGAVMPSQIMGYCWRYQFPTLPTLAVLAGLGCSLLGGLAWRLRQPLLQFGGALLAPTALLLVAIGAAADEARHMRDVYAPGLQRAHAPLGRFLRENPPPGRAGVLAIGDAGAVPYHSGWRTIDTFGLNEPTIARTGVHDPAPVLAKRPDVLVLISKSPWHFLPWLPYEAALHDAAVAAGMVKSNVLRFADDYFLWSLALPGPVATALQAWRPEGAVGDPFRDPATADPTRPLRPLGLRHGALELVDCVWLANGLGLRTRGTWQPDQTIVVLTLAANGDAPAVTVDCRPDPRLAELPAAAEKVHWLPLPRLARAGDVMQLAVVLPAPPYPRLAAADGRTVVELRWPSP